MTSCVESLLEGWQLEFVEHLCGTAGLTIISEDDSSSTSLNGLQFDLVCLRMRIHPAPMPHTRQ